MELDVSINRKSVSIPIENPFRLDMEGIIVRIEELAAVEGVKINGLDVRGLLPLMVKGLRGAKRAARPTLSGLSHAASAVFLYNISKAGYSLPQPEWMEEPSFHLNCFRIFNRRLLHSKIMLMSALTGR